MPSSKHERAADICEFTAAVLSCTRANPSPPFAGAADSRRLHGEDDISSADHAPVYGPIPMTWTPWVSDILYIWTPSWGVYVRGVREKYGGVNMIQKHYMEIRKLKELIKYYMSKKI